MSETSPPPALRHVIVADEWLQAAVVWLVPILGFLCVANVTFVRFGLPPAISARQWAFTHAVFVGPGLAFVALRLWALSRRRRSFVTLSGTVAKVSRPPFRAGWCFQVTYAFEGATYSRRFLVRAVDHYRTLAGTTAAPLLVDPRHPEHARLLVTVLNPFAV